MDKGQLYVRMGGQLLDFQVTVEWTNAISYYDTDSYNPSGDLSTTFLHVSTSNYAHYWWHKLEFRIGTDGEVFTIDDCYTNSLKEGTNVVPDLTNENLVNMSLSQPEVGSLTGTIATHLPDVITSAMLQYGRVYVMNQYISGPNDMPNMVYQTPLQMGDDDTHQNLYINSTRGTRPGTCYVAECADSDNRTIGRAFGADA